MECNKKKERKTRKGLEKDVEEEEVIADNTQYKNLVQGKRDGETNMKFKKQKKILLIV